MLTSGTPIFLASQSPRRKKLLEQIGIDFSTFSASLNEVIYPNEGPIAAVKRLALEKLNKAEEVYQNGIIITADTIVVLDNNIIGKPVNKEDAGLILRKLSGRTHSVYTGFAIKNCVTNKEIVDYEMTEVTFRKLSDDEISDYIKDGSPLDKAGAYGIQDDYGAVFVSKINGCYYNVVGLPLSKVFLSLKTVI